jgi:hypothetical protein
VLNEYCVIKQDEGKEWFTGNSIFADLTMDLGRLFIYNWLKQVNYYKHEPFIYLESKWKEQHVLILYEWVTKFTEDDSLQGSCTM